MNEARSECIATAKLEGFFTTHLLSPRNYTFVLIFKLSIGNNYCFDCLFLFSDISFGWKQICGHLDKAPKQNLRIKHNLNFLILRSNNYFQGMIC